MVARRAPADDDDEEEDDDDIDETLVERLIGKSSLSCFLENKKSLDVTCKTFRRATRQRLAKANKWPSCVVLRLSVFLFTINKQ